MTTTLEICLAQLRALIETENAGLERMDIGEVAPLAAEKNRLVKLLRELLSNPSCLPDLAEMRPRITALSRASDDNKMLLERAMLVQRRLMSIVAEATRPPATGYGKTGTATNHPGTLPRAMIARA